MDDSHYAISLFALMKRPQNLEQFTVPDSLLDQLQIYLDQQLGIRCLSVKVLERGNDPLLLLNEVDASSLAPLCSLADVQKTSLFRYERTSESEVTLTPVILSPGD